MHQTRSSDPLRSRPLNPVTASRGPGSRMSRASRIEVTAVRLAVTFLGLDLFSVDVSTEQAGEDDCSRDLSGGYLGSDRIDAGSTDRYLGFTNGRECGDDD